jgi:hypothetical protein
MDDMNQDQSFKLPASWQAQLDAIRAASEGLAEVERASDPVLGPKALDDLFALEDPRG